MANRAYASIWCREFTEAVMEERLEQLLETVPLSQQLPAFSSLVIRAVGPEETPLVDRDLRAAPVDPQAIAQMARECLHADCAYEIAGHWDLWVYDRERAGWQLRPQPLEIVCCGEEYDGGAHLEMGHFQIEAGFEHLFTGHAGLLGARGRPAVPQHPLEAEFLSRMARPEALGEYREKTRENIRGLLEWIGRIETALPVARYRLWSEGEDDFEARLDEILALG